MTRHPAHDIYTYLGAHPAEQGFTCRSTSSMRAKTMKHTVSSVFIK